MTTFCIVGVDPGFRFSAVVARRGNDVCHHAIVSRQTDGPPDAAYIGLVLGEVSTARRTFAGSGGNRPDTYVAVEGLTKPRAFRDGKPAWLDPTHVLGTAMVLGAVLAIWPDALVVPPGRHGRAGQLAYPKALWGEREGPGGKGIRQHERAAFDVAGAAVLLIRERQQQRLAV